MQATLDSFDTTKLTEQELYEVFCKTDIFYVYEVNEKILGFVSGTKDRVNSLFVAIDFHGMGIGRALMERFEHDAIVKGSQCIKIEASLYAAEFYERLGYCKRGGIEDYMGLKVYNMVKEVPS